MSVNPLSENPLYSNLQKNASDAGWTWFSQQIELIKSSDEPSRLDIALAMARRKLGDSLLDPDLAVLPGWRQCDAGRVLLLLEALRNPKLIAALDGEKLVWRAYKLGDEYEKEAILKGLSLLDPAGELSQLAVDACRTNILPMLAAVALFNAYPATFFAEHEFNQMVLKSLFLGLDIVHVGDLSRRANPALSRMCFDYLRERLAANRDLPASIWLAIRPSDIEASLEYLEQCLAMDNALLKGYARESLRRYCAGVAAFCHLLADS